MRPQKVGARVALQAVGSPEQQLALRDCFITEANAILTSTLGPGGGFLDDGSAFGIYARLDLYAAAGKAAALAAGRPTAAE